jgi:RNA-directed DNA polymerase
LTKRNTHATADVQTQGWKTITSRLMSVREAAKKDKEVQFSSLLHHITVDLLEKSFYSLKRGSAAGIDGMSWVEYERALDENLGKLKEAIQSGKYKPKPARRIYIPKADGSKRPISIQSIEDKVAQQAIAIILEQIYETGFLGFSYGFRPGRSQHDALDALYVGIKSKKIHWVLDLDIKKFFDTVEHAWLIRFLKHRIVDKRVLRLITQWITVGYQDAKGRRHRAAVGMPQGAVISPILSNI